MNAVKTVKRIIFSLIILGTAGLSWYAISEGAGFIWAFQQPTYLLEKDTPGLTSYTCDTTKDACKVNFDFSASVPTDEPSTHYSCLIDFGFGVTGEEAKCNPNTVEFPVGTWSLHIIVKKIADDAIVNEGNITVIHSDDSIDPLRVTHTREWQSPSYLLGKEDTTLSEYTCDPEQAECKVNLKIAALLDGIESSQLTCEITSDFDFAPTTEPCNPNTSIVPMGDHIVTIKILDKIKGLLLQTYTLILKNPPIDTTIDPTRVVTDIAWQQPTYLLEKEDITKTTYNCNPSESECKVNLLVVPKLDGIETSKLSCNITTDFGVDEHDCNPDTFIVPNGPHTLTIETKNTASGDLISTRIITLQGMPIVTEGGGGGSSTPPMDITRSQIVVQSGLDEYFVCKTDICQVNFLADVPTGALCRWDFGSGIFETVATDEKCNPGYVKFSSDTPVKLVVTDPMNSSNTLTKTLQIYKMKPFTDEGNLVSHIELQTKITNTKRITSSGILCGAGKSGKCSLNFTGTSSIGAKTWHWDFGDGTVVEKENPGSHTFHLGKYQIRLIVSDGMRNHTALYDVEVVEDFDQKCLDCEKIRGKIEISAALPNPPHTDTVEWIEIRNLSTENISLDGCEIADETEDFELFGTLTSGKTLRLRQAMTGLSLGNTHDVLELMCGGELIDDFSWDFPIPTGYILRREVLYGLPQETTIISVIDGDTVDAMIDGKKTRVRLLGIDTPETVHPRKPIEKFGKEASDFAKRALEGKSVWLTFDGDPIDHYGRRLAYIWQCNGAFSESSCSLFNAQVVSQGYGRMERRFGFRFYGGFDDLEKQAKERKMGIWSDPEVAKAMSVLSADEKDLLTSDQEKEYLELQEELLQECVEQEVEGCEEKKPTWKEVTEKMSTLSVGQRKSGIVTISGRTWGDFPVEIDIYRGTILFKKIVTSSNEVGEYKETWTPEVVGDFVIKSIFQKEADIVQKEKSVTIEILSPHFDTRLTARIILQGQITDNRWLEGDIFHCRSRGSCSINLIAENNREGDVSYFWIFPDGSMTDEKNPGAIKLNYGQFDIILITSDDITGDMIASTLKIDHQPIPKKARNTSTSTKYTLDIKDVPPDIGGGVIPDEPSPLRGLLGSVALLLFLASTVYSLFFLKL